MKINNLGYLFKEGIRGIFLHGFMSFAAICVTVACLLIVGSFSALMYNMSIMVEDLNQTNEMMVYVDSELSDAEAKSIGTQINQIENVYKSEFISREKALETFLEKHQDDDSYSGVDSADLRHRYQVILVDNALMEDTYDRIESIPGVVKISAEFALAEGFSALERVLRVAWVSVSVVLLVVSLLIISNTVKLAMYDRRDEIAIMKMVGATNGFIRLPFVVEGFTLGMLGAGVSFGLEWLMYNAFVSQISSIDALGLFSFVPFHQLLIPMILTFAGAGMFVGIVGSWTSIRKFMNV